MYNIRNVFIDKRNESSISKHNVKVFVTAPLGECLVLKKGMCRGG